MTKICTFISLFFLLGLFSGCSQVLQTVDLNINSEDSSMQEEFNVVEKTLTIREANAQKTVPYSRIVLKNGRGQNAQPIPEKLALKSEFPKSEGPKEYILGIGDSITFSRLLENNRSNNQTSNQWPVDRKVSDYKLGIGDTLALTLIKTTKTSQQLTSGSEEENESLLEKKSMRRLIQRVELGQMVVCYF